MKNFDSFFSTEKMTRYLCKKRASLAGKRSEDHLLALLSRTELKSYEAKLRHSKATSEIDSIMPPRRSWIKLGKRRRCHSGQSLNASDKNADSIYLTIQRDRQRAQPPDYLARLDRFLQETTLAINSLKHVISEPRIHPEIKDKELTPPEYRPIASFGLRDNLIICFVNKYFAQLFDDLFYHDAFAFRAVRIIDGEARTPNHHDAFQRVLDYEADNRGVPIYVAECDMKKFFDTVNHKIVLRNFRSLKRALPRGTKCDPRAEHILKSYLECYNFKRNITPLNNNAEYFRKFGEKAGVFPWVEEIGSIYPFGVPREIGIPQGGALSGLIANIVLWSADRKVRPLEDAEMLYVRYCDDMILMHTDSQKCKTALTRYSKALKAAKLFPHKVETLPYGKKFWKLKTKGPYVWSEDHIPWVGFVGYEVNRLGETRVRPKSLKKERTKQEQLVARVIHATEDGNLRAENSIVVQSTAMRLIGMSVGRVEIWNHSTYKPDMCWVSGFKLLNVNKFTVRQARFLDRSRNKNLRKLVRHLRSLPPLEFYRDPVPQSNSQILFKGKPFSYYNQIVENGRKLTSSST